MAPVEALTSVPNGALGATLGIVGEQQYIVRGIVRAFVNAPIAAGVNGKGRCLRQCHPGAGEAAEIEPFQRTVAGSPDRRIPGPHLMLARAIDDNDTVRSRKYAGESFARPANALEPVGKIWPANEAGVLAVAALITSTAAFVRSAM